MMIRCPACKVDNETGPNCRRCKADLSLVFVLEARRNALLASGWQEVALGHWPSARASAEEAHGLRADAASLKLVALTALLCRDFHQAARSYELWREAPEG